MDFQYRIKVKVKNNGEKQYIPQVGTPKLKIGKFDYLWIDWNNLFPYYGGNYVIESVDILATIETNFDNENDAEDVINFHKKELRRTKDEETKNIYFIKK